MKKAPAYVGIIISLILLIKISTDRMRHAPMTDSTTGSEATELPTSEFPVDYSLGQFDERFGISRVRFLQIAEEAKKIWEDSAGRGLFELHQDGSLKVNLIFDWRQERLLEATKARAKLDENGRSFDQLQADYNGRARTLGQYRRSYEESAQTYKIHLDEYNARVAHWNKSKDHKDSEDNAPQSARKEIGLGHVDNPKAIMYRKLAVQDFSTIRLTSDDLNLLLAKVK